LRGQSNNAGLRGLDRRIAFLPLRLKGTTPGRLVAGMLATCAFLSMWISNTAAVAEVAGLHAKISSDAPNSVTPAASAIT
jgi:di/tricarboxylate transporter